ncbi:MAG: prolyl oligopeptidase family serine peptidase [Patescibacteria group bacterium]
MSKPFIAYSTMGKLVSTIYIPASRPAPVTIIYAKGAPTSWDSGNKDILEVACKHNVNIIVPDYYGHARSYGTFSLKGCVDTIADTYDYVSNGVSLVNYLDGHCYDICSKHILVLGSSFGGGVVSCLPIFTNDPKYYSTLAYLAPVTDWVSQGVLPNIPEENLDNFNTQLINIFPNIYRGYEGSDFHSLVTGVKEFVDKYNPILNVNTLSNSHVIIAHGSRDKAIHWRKSQHYAQELQKAGASVDFKLLRNIRHGGAIKKVGLDWIISTYLSHAKSHKEKKR